MIRASSFIVPVLLSVGLCGLLRADDSPSSASPATGRDYQAMDTYLWFIEHTAAIAKDPDAAAVAGVLQANEILKARDPQVAIDFFTKALFNAKSHTVQRAIRMQLAQLLKNAGQNDQALAQLQELINDQDSQ